MKCLRLALTENFIKRPDLSTLACVNATYPRSRDSVQGAFRKAKQRADITKLGVAIHTLRHSYTTHLLEAGVNLRLITG